MTTSRMEWEQHKENIKPKREGRNISSLNTTPKNTAQMASIQDRQAQFEQEIREYEGNDELEVWIRYLTFMQDSFPEGDFKSKITSIQLRLIERFQEVDKYKQDKRILDVIIDMASRSKDPPQVYGYCYFNGLCTKSPMFWQQWITSWMFIQRYDKAFMLCKTALKFFKNPPRIFTALKMDILRLQESQSLASPGEKHRSDVREVGTLIKENVQQDQLPGPKPITGKTNKSFSILKDRNKAAETVPICSTNVLETANRTKENLNTRRQRWKHAKHTSYALPSEDQTAEKFSIFEDKAERVNNNAKYSHGSSALQVKKLKDVPGLFQSKTKLNPVTNLVETCAYHKSKVYPAVGEEWSFEEIEAQRRFFAKQKNQSDASEYSKRSISDVDEDSVTEMVESKRPCQAEEDTERSTLMEDSERVKKPLKSCLSSRISHSNLTADFKLEKSGLLSSTKKIPGPVDEPVPEPVESVMRPSADNTPLHERPPLNLSIRSSLLELAAERDITKDEFSCKDLADSVGFFAQPDPQEVHKPEVIRGLFTKNKTKTNFLNNSLPDDGSYEKEPTENIGFNINVDSPNDKPDHKASFQNRMPRDSEVFDIFRDSPKPNRTKEESYSLNKVAITPCGPQTFGGSVHGYEPCTVEKAGNRLDTQKISKQYYNILNDCSKISESDNSPRSTTKKGFEVFSDDNAGLVPDADDTEKAVPEKKNRVTFAVLETTEAISTVDCSKTSEDSEGTIPMTKFDHDFDFEDTPKPKFEVYSDAFVNHSKCDDVSAFDYNRDDRNQLTPILEGSRESDSSSTETKTPAVSQRAPDFNLPTISEQSITNVDVTEKEIDNPKDTEEQLGAMKPPASESKTTGKVATGLSFDNFSPEFTTQFKPEVSVQQHHRLEPDRTFRDFHLDVSCLTNVPRRSMIPTEPVTDPFNSDTIVALIRALDPPLILKEGFNQIENEDVVPSGSISLGPDIEVSDVTLVGKGAFAKVYKGLYSHGKDQRKVALKAQSPPAPWEFYILSELHNRLSESNTAKQISDMILPFYSFYVFRNASILVMRYFDEGSLLDMINCYLERRQSIPPAVICTYTLDMLRCVQALHAVGIIHGDIKPDNWLLRDKYDTMNSISLETTKSVVLIDFGRSIDMRILPPNSEFTVRCNTENFECVEMQTERPWTYQTDYHGFLSCVNLLMHKDYLKVHQEKGSSRWKPNYNPPRQVDRLVFGRLFDELLNVPSCKELPDLGAHIDRIQGYLSSLNQKERYWQMKEHYDLLTEYHSNTSNLRGT